MLSWQDVMMKQEQYKDLLRESENDAIVQQALGEQKRRAPLASGLLMAPVQLLVNLFAYLLECFTFVINAPVQARSRDAGTNENL